MDEQTVIIEALLEKLQELKTNINSIEAKIYVVHIARKFYVSIVLFRILIQNCHIWIDYYFVQIKFIPI